MRSLLTLSLLAVLLSACGGEGQAPATARGPTTPGDPALADVYNRSCRSCHAQGQAKAPLTGDREAWALRLEQGMDVLLEHTISGYNGMPPMGMCMDCSMDQFEALIVFMATGEG